LRGILGASDIFLARDFRFSLVVQFESIGTEGDASAATDASLMIDFYHVILLRKSRTTNAAHANI
jgi:hypothetical protein